MSTSSWSTGEVRKHRSRFLSTLYTRNATVLSLHACSRPLGNAHIPDLV